MPNKYELANEIARCLAGVEPTRAVMDLFRAARAKSPIIESRVQSAVESIGSDRIPPEVGELIGEVCADADSEERTSLFRLRLTPAERGELDRLAMEAGVTASQFVRMRVFGREK